MNVEENIDQSDGTDWTYLGISRAPTGNEFWKGKHKNIGTVDIEEAIYKAMNDVQAETGYQFEREIYIWHPSQVAPAVRLGILSEREADALYPDWRTA